MKVKMVGQIASYSREDEDADVSKEVTIDVVGKVAGKDVQATLMVYEFPSEFLKDVKLLGRVLVVLDFDPNESEL